MKKSHIVFVLSVCLGWAYSTVAMAQTDTLKKNNAKKEFGAMLQVYPAGVITTINLEAFSKNNGSFIFRAGGNFANRKDYSPYNDFEKGKGFGLSLGCRKYISLKRGSVLAGFNCDIWSMWVHWENEMGQPNWRAGQTYTLVVQPWMELGYSLPIKQTPFQLKLSAAFGREINAVTQGKEVGQGWMNSGALYIQYALK